MPTIEELKKRAVRFKTLTAKLDSAKKADEARHYRKLAKRMQRRARTLKAKAPKPAEAKPAEAKPEEGATEAKA